MNLSDKIWITRKTRIYTEKRLRNKAIMSEIFVIFFSLLIVFLSIRNYLNSNQDINFLLICGSITFLTVSIFLSSQKFVERANAMRNCYIRLDDLYFKVKDCENTTNTELLNDYQTNYNDILINIENHSDYDFLCLRYSLRKKKDTTLDPFTNFDLLHFIAEKAIRIILMLIIFSFPFILLLIRKLFF